MTDMFPPPPRSGNDSEERLPIIDLVKVSKVYPPDTVALRDVSLTIHRGEVLFLAGMSGAGKSTLLKLLCGLEKPSRGAIEVAGHDLARISKRDLQRLRQKVSMAYQDLRLLPHLTAAENIAMAMEVTYKNPTAISKRVDELLDMLLLADKKNTPAGRLSRGEQQRVAIARAAANAPPIILADEPTGNLDATISSRVMQLFSQLNAAGTTVVIATHDETIFRNTGHRLLEISRGRLLPCREEDARRYRKHP